MISGVMYRFRISPDAPSLNMPVSIRHAAAPVTLGWRLRVAPTSGRRRHLPLASPTSAQPSSAWASPPACLAGAAASEPSQRIGDWRDNANHPCPVCAHPRQERGVLNECHLVDREIACPSASGQRRLS
jgi:hypothetical protein